MYLRLPLRASTVFVCLGMESHSRTALYQDGRIDVRLTYSLRHPQRRRAALSFLFCSSLSMIDFYRSSQVFSESECKGTTFFWTDKIFRGFFFESPNIWLYLFVNIRPTLHHLRNNTQAKITKMCQRFDPNNNKMIFLKKIKIFQSSFQYRLISRNREQNQIESQLRENEACTATITGVCFYFFIAEEDDKPACGSRCRHRHKHLKAQ